MWRARVNVLKTHYGLYARFSLKIVASKQAFNGWSDAHANSSSQGSRVAWRHAIYTNGSYSQENLSNEAARALCQRCTMHFACWMQNTARTTWVTLCILANWLLRAVVTYLSFSFSLCFSSSLYRNERDSLLSFLHARDSFVNFVFLLRFYGKKMSFSLFTKFFLRIQLLII